METCCKGNSTFLIKILASVYIYMHDVHFILTYSISVYSFWNGSKSHLPNLYKIQEPHLIVPETSVGIEQYCKVDSE